MKSVHLELYVLKGAPDSQQTLSVFQEVCRMLGERCVSRVIDVASSADETLKAGVLVTPTLIKRGPEPTKRIIGRLQDPLQVLGILEIEEIA